MDVRESRPEKATTRSGALHCKPQKLARTVLSRDRSFWTREGLGAGIESWDANTWFPESGSHSSGSRKRLAGRLAQETVEFGKNIVQLRGWLGSHWLGGLQRRKLVGMEGRTGQRFGGVGRGQLHPEPRMALRGWDSFYGNNWLMTRSPQNSTCHGRASSLWILSVGSRDCICLITYVVPRR